MISRRENDSKEWKEYFNLSQITFIAQSDIIARIKRHKEESVGELSFINECFPFLSKVTFLDCWH